MNPPLNEIELEHSRTEGGRARDETALHHCDLCDADKIYKLAQELLPGLASACVDNTTGGLFKSPASVAIDIRREMVDYLIQRSETYVAETVILDNGADEIVHADPHDIITEFIDDFAGSKRNFFSRVSGWVLSDRREDRIDEFVQEMEINGFWLLNRRESVAQTLLKNVDFRNLYHCIERFKSGEDLEEHRPKCGFRTLICDNEGCNARFSAAQLDHHDSLCPFKMLDCEQKCEAIVMRREMDRHCITVCPMKLVKCPFFSVGCYSSVPQRKIDEHRVENLDSHVRYALRVLHKEASEEDLEERVELLKASFLQQLEAARDARSLTFKIKDFEAKLGPMKSKSTAKSDDDEAGDSSKKDEVAKSPAKRVTFEDSKEIKRENSMSSSGSSDHEVPVEPPKVADEKLQPQHVDEEIIASKSVQESPHQGEEQKKKKSEDEEAIEANERGNISSGAKVGEKNYATDTKEGAEEIRGSKSNASSESEEDERKDISSPVKVEEKMDFIANKDQHVDEINHGNASSESEEDKHKDISSPVKVEEKMDFVTSYTEEHIDEVNHGNASSDSEADEREEIRSPRISVEEKIDSITDTEEHVEKVSDSQRIGSNTSSESEE